MKPDIYWIPGPWRRRLAVLPRPRGGDWLESEADGWARAGLNVIVSLLDAAESDEFDLRREQEVAESRAIRFTSFPIEDRGIPASTGKARALLEDLIRELESGRNVGVHCRQGIGRSALIAAGLLVLSGSNVQQAVDAVSIARGQKTPETAAQLEWIRGLRSADLACTR
jgi:protein-tyrosine phosphatase